MSACVSLYECATVCASEHVEGKKSRLSISGFFFANRQYFGRIGKSERYIQSGIVLLVYDIFAYLRFSCCSFRWSFRQMETTRVSENGHFFFNPRCAENLSLSFGTLAHSVHAKIFPRMTAVDRSWSRASCRAAIEPLSYFANVVLLTTWRFPN